MKISLRAKHAILIGSLCSISYLAVYIARNILSVVTPQMIEAGYTEAYIGSISSLYFISYAIGQLINGFIGDKIRAKWMLFMGLSGAACTNLLFSLIPPSQPVPAMIAYAMTGFALSMIYGPIMKVVSENTEPVHATRCALGFTFADFFGSPTAGILATFLAWQTVFSVGSGMLLLMAILGFLCFTAFERKKVIQYGLFPKKEKGKGSLKLLLQRHIVKFSIISVLTGIVRTSVMFWLPTYISQHLSFSPKSATSIFTVASFIISLTTFVAIFIYERLRYNMDKTILLMFSSSAFFFTLTYFVKHPAVNIVALVLAIMSSNGAATMLFSRYLPSLRDTGIVSSVTGYIDFLSYMAAALANLIFANAVAGIGWKNLILVWLGLMIVGIIIALPYDRMKKAKE